MAEDHPPWVLKDRQEVANRIRGWRSDRKLTQEELAHLAGVDRSTVQRLESGNWEVKLSTLSRLAHALGVSMVVLLDRPG
ncbi:helix-turn-helix domain-containing protein [Streptomyces sp. NBC_01498]|uniref:helix-turn-helix domain-containing protein n=1 Tax=Streptomyces sp. NBC_01498 TaxID=2975870 RepID=UPI003FCD0A90